MSQQPLVVLATSNAGKAREFATMLASNVQVATFYDLGFDSPEETGSTFLDNAVLKAREISRLTDHLVVADDSGLVVDALGGAPGIYSARYSGEPPDDQRNIDHLLAQMAGIPGERRTARYQCAVAVARCGKVLLTSEGACSGVISYETRGTNGFGYDPIFILSDGRTMAELSDAEKNQISHRAVAFRAVANALRELIDELDITGDARW